MPTRIIVADDHPLFRSAIINLLQRILNDAQITEVESFAQLSQQLHSDEHIPSLVILDLKLPDVQGLDGLLNLKKQYSELPIVIVSGYDDTQVIRQTKAYGANGFISKSLEMEAMAQAIVNVLQGDLYFPDSISQTKDDASVSGIAQLTPTQLNVLALLKEGKPSKTMADTLGVTEATIKAHLTTIFKKLSVRNRTQAVIVAKQMDISANLPK